jgi:hypothetical protein
VPLYFFVPGVSCPTAPFVTTLPPVALDLVLASLVSLLSEDVQLPFENQTVQFSNGHFPDTICVWISIGLLPFKNLT